MIEHFLIITTINSPTNAVLSLAEGANNKDVAFIIVGDTKTPNDFHVKNTSYLSIAKQELKFPDISSVLPKAHYTRKNIGYLEAISNGANLIQETDDDNFPYDEFWIKPDSEIIGEEFACKPWANVYSLFSEKRIWPRGLPLEYVHLSKPTLTQFGSVSSKGLIIQGLADENPDVDAIYRLTCDLPISFNKRPPIIVQSGSWCPFNSQNTIFRKEAFPLLYLPSMCSFRMTDIWRSFVAQRCLWELGEGLVFTSASVWQERNEHNLFKDFTQEVDGYLLNDRIRQTLDDIVLNSKDLSSNLRTCYETLVRSELLPKEELQIVYKWCESLDYLA
jgi:hypothetical protein